MIPLKRIQGKGLSLPPGDYFVETIKAGYVSDTKMIRIHSGGQQRVEVRLKKK